MTDFSGPNFLGKVALITGGAQGIGQGVVRYFLERGASVAMIDADQEALEETQVAFEKLGPLLSVQADVLLEADVKRALGATLERFGRLDFLVSNAGISEFTKFDELTLEGWRRVLDTNLTAAFLFARYAAPHLREARGAIVNIASTRAIMSEPNSEAYAASKGGIVALTHALAISLGPQVRVNCVSPGWIETRDRQKASARREVKYSPQDLEQHPVGRVGTPEDVAALVAFLCSSEAGFITGQNYLLDGGMTRKMIYVE